jgi:glycosyltransferase involved in cell wall biosynthesis
VRKEEADSIILSGRIVSKKPHLVIITPALADANNGNWQTARRWADFLAERYSVTILPEWNGTPADAMIALHARKSASSLAAYATAFPGRPSILVLTGTDLYRDIHHDERARASLATASRLVVLQEAGMRELDKALQHKTCVIYQSARSLAPSGQRKFAGGEVSGNHGNHGNHGSHGNHGNDNSSGSSGSTNGPGRFEVIMIGHLREEKDPVTYMRAARLVSHPSIRMMHIGGALDPALRDDALATARSVPHYCWLDARPHAGTRRRLQRSSLMVLCSRMEGGANVIIEAVTSGVPVIASDISGNRGMLGDDYPGFFPAGDSAALAAMIERAATDRAWLDLLAAHCARRAKLFAPETEQAAVLRLMDNLGFRASSPPVISDSTSQ